MARRLTTEQVRELLKQMAAAGGQAAWASKNGLSTSYVNEVLSGRRDPGPKILEALSLRRVVEYERIRRAE